MHHVAVSHYLLLLLCHLNLHLHLHPHRYHHARHHNHLHLCRHGLNYYPQYLDYLPRHACPCLHYRHCHHHHHHRQGYNYCHRHCLNLDALDHQLHLDSDYSDPHQSWHCC